MKRYNEQEMRRLYAMWLESGNTKIVFCKEEGIVKSPFYYWAKKFQDPLSGSRIKESGFAPLVLRPNIPLNNPRPAFRINYSSGTSVDFFDTVDPGFIKELCQ